MQIKKSIAWFFLYLALGGLLMEAYMAMESWNCELNFFPPFTSGWLAGNALAGVVSGAVLLYWFQKESAVRSGRCGNFR